MKLSKTEEQLMRHLWKLERATLKELIDEYDDPKPATTTTATLLKRMQEKGFVDYTSLGKARQYFPLVDKKSYFGTHFRGLINNFFGNSAATFASFFTQATDLNQEELEALREEIDAAIKKKKKKS